MPDPVSSSRSTKDPFVEGLDPPPRRDIPSGLQVDGRSLDDILASLPDSPITLARDLAIAAPPPREVSHSDACAGASPTLLRSSKDFHMREFPTSEDIASCTKRGGLCLDPVAVEALHQRVCAETGVDPYRFALASTYERSFKGAPEMTEEEELRGRLSMIESMSDNPLAAAAYLYARANDESIAQQQATVGVGDATFVAFAVIGAARANESTEAANDASTRTGEIAEDAIGKRSFDFEYKGDGDASFFVEREGGTLRARGEIEGAHVGRKKARPPDPPGGRASGDHRGHLIPEGGVRDAGKVNVPENIISESPGSNLGPKKRFDLLASKIAAENPGRRVETVHEPKRIGNDPRPAFVNHQILVDGQVVHRVCIPNERKP